MWHTTHWLEGIELVNRCLIGWPDWPLRNGGIRGGRVAQVSVLGIGTGVGRRPIVRVDHVAGRTAAGSEVAWMVIGAEQGQQRVEQTGPLQIQPYGIGPIEGSEAARAQPVGWPTRQFVNEGNTELQRALPAPLEDPEHVTRLADLEARERLEELEHPSLGRSPPGWAGASCTDADQAHRARSSHRTGDA